MKKVILLHARRGWPQGLWPLPARVTRGNGVTSDRCLRRAAMKKPGMKNWAVSPLVARLHVKH